jgi:hypothetical protein
MGDGAIAQAASAGLAVTLVTAHYSQLALEDGMSRYMTAGGTALMIAMFGAATLRGREHPPRPGHILEGTWRLVVTPYICGTDSTLPPFAALVTYARGGTASGTSNSAHFLPGQRTPEFGTWSHANGRLYRSTREAFILFPSPQPGLVRGTQRIDENIVVTNDRLRSEGASRLTDEAGNVVMTGCARSDGERMQ